MSEYSLPEAPKPPSNPPTVPEFQQEPPSTGNGNKKYAGIFIGIVGLVTLGLVVLSSMSSNQIETEDDPKKESDSSAVVEASDSGPETAPAPNAVSKPVIPVVDEEGWTDLLAGGLGAWNPWLGSPHHTVDLPGSPAVAEGKWRPKLGSKDPTGVFSIVQKGGMPTLRVSGEINGGLSTNEKYKNYHFSARFKWGEKRWPGALIKTEQGKDAGICFHCFSPPGSLYAFWRNAVEYQIRSWTAGDLWMLGTQCLAPTSVGTRYDGTKFPTFKRGWPLEKVTDYIYRNQKSQFHKTDWNTAEIYAFGNDSVFTLNGKTVIIAVDIKKNHEGATDPLDEGEIMIQSAGAEIFFQEVKLRKIDDFPEDIKVMVDATKP